MIQYDNGMNALALLLQMTGSVLPRVAPMAGISCLLAVLFGQLKNFADGLEQVIEIQHLFSVQIYAIILGYVIVFRTNMALGRYMMGIENVQTMLSKWGDAYMQLVAFTNSSARAGADAEKASTLRLQLLHWFTLMAAVAVHVLQKGEPESFTWIAARPYPTSLTDAKARARNARRSEAGPRRVESKGWMEKLGFGRSAVRVGEERKRQQREALRAALAQAGVPPKSKGCCRRRPEIESEALASVGTDTGGDLTPKSRAAKEAALKATKGMFGTEIIGEITKEEEALLLIPGCDKLLLLAEWISEAITTAAHSGTLKTPPPILSRVYQELSNGMLGFNQAFKIALVPFPFPFAQMLAALLMGFLILCPMIIHIFTANVWLGPVASFIAIMGYWGLNEIAVELENPFGDDANDLPLAELVLSFVDALEAVAKTTCPQAQSAMMESAKASVATSLARAQRESHAPAADSSVAVPVAH